jgi:hypothetical protein
VRLQGQFETVPADWRLLMPIHGDNVPSNIMAAARLRMKDYLPDLQRLFGSRGEPDIRSDIEHLAAGYFEADKEYSQASTVARRRARLDQISAAITDMGRQAMRVADLLGQIAEDDGALAGGPLVAALRRVLADIGHAEKLLSVSTSGLKPRSRGDNRKAAPSAVKWFSYAVDCLWTCHASAPRGNFNEWRELVFEVITGEENRSFAKIDRARNRERTLLRTRHSLIAALKEDVGS